MEGFDIVTLLAHVVLVSTLTTMVYAVLVYFASRRKSRKSKARPLPLATFAPPAKARSVAKTAVPAPMAYAQRKVPLVSVHPLALRNDTVQL